MKFLKFIYNNILNNKEYKARFMEMVYVNQSGSEPKWNPSAKINPTNSIDSFIYQTQIEQHLFATIPGTVGDL